MSSGIKGHAPRLLALHQYQPLYPALSPGSRRVRIPGTRGGTAHHLTLSEPGTASEKPGQALSPGYYRWQGA